MQLRRCLSINHSPSTRPVPKVRSDVGCNDFVPKLISWIVRHQGWIRGLQVERSARRGCRPQEVTRSVIQCPKSALFLSSAH